jgi:hypothetical protein
MGFVLYGGTAIALRLGHRQSVDFDFFSAAALDKEAIRNRLAFMPGSEPLQDEQNTLTVLLSNKVKVSFFGGLSFGRYGHPEMTSDGVLCVASMDDLMALKLKVLLQRIEARDYVDIAEMLRANVSLEKGLAIATAMFAPNFSPNIALKALVYFEEESLRNLSGNVKKTIADAAADVSALPSVSKLSDILS